MTIGTSNRNDATGNDSTGTYPYGFKIFAATDLQVKVRDSADLETTLVYSTQYTVSSVGSRSGGNVVLANVGGDWQNVDGTLKTGYSITIRRVRPLTQATDIRNQGSFFADVHEDTFDHLVMIDQQQQDEIDRSFKLPVTEDGSNVTTELPAAASRAGKFFAFDGSGNAIASDGTGNDSTLRSELATTSDTSKASALIGWLRTGTGAVATTLRRLLGWFAPRVTEFMTTSEADDVTSLTGAIDVTAAIRAAYAAHSTLVFPKGKYKVSKISGAAALIVPSNAFWMMEGAEIVHDTATDDTILIDTVSDVALVGKWKGTGGGSTIGSAKFIRVKDGTRWLVEKPTISSVKGWGFYLEPGASTSARGVHGQLRSPVIYDCYYGYEDTPGTGAEYCTIENPRIYGCTIHGLKTAAGNVIVNGGHIVDNIGKGVHLVAGSNHGHGIFNGVNINHNGSYGVHAEAVTNGFTFNGCHIYQNDVWLDRSKGIQFTGGHFDPAHVYNYKDGSSGLNVIECAYFPGSYGPSRAAGGNNGHDELIMRPTCWGPGSYATVAGLDTLTIQMTDPSDCFVRTQRDAASTQALVSGVGSTLTYNAQNYFYDRRLVQAAGTFTIKQTGLHYLDFDLLFTGVAMNAGASKVDVKVNGAVVATAYATAFGTTDLQVRLSISLYLTLADALLLEGIITGTTPLFGHGTRASSVTLRKA